MYGIDTSESSGRSKGRAKVQDVQDNDGYNLKGKISIHVQYNRKEHSREGASIVQRDPAADHQWLLPST